MASLENDDLINLYMKKDTPKASSLSVGKSIANDDLIKQYMKSDSSKPEKAGAAPTGYNAVTGETSYNKPSEVATGSHTPSVIKDTAINAARAAGTGLFNAGVEAGSGLREALSGQPASGIGKIGMAPLTAIGALTTDPLSSVAGDVLGKPNADVPRYITGAPTGQPAIDTSLGERVGNAVGFALPVVPSIKSLNAARPTNRAFKDLVEMIGPENAGDVAKAMRSDPRLTPADLSPAVQSATQKLFVIEGDKPKNYINNIVNQRASGANAAVNAAMDASLGSRVDPVAKLDELKTNIVNAGKQAIEPALAKTKPVDITPIVNHIDDTLKPGVNAIISNPESMLPYPKVKETLQNWRDFITNDKVNLTDPNELHKLQSAIRRQAEGLVKSSDGEQRSIGYALYGLRNEFINAIGKAGPQTTDKAGNAISEYRLGLSKYRDENDVADAFRHGHDAIIKNGRGLEDNPEFFKQWVKEASPEEKEAAKQGANIAIRTAMNAYRAPVTNTTSKAQQMAQIDFNRQRIEALFGKEQAERIFTKLENERKIAETNNNLIHGSQTAMRSAADSRVALPTKTDMVAGFIPPAILEAGSALAGGLPGLGTATYTGARLAGFAKNKIATAMAKEKNAQLAKYALPTEGQSREQLIRQLEGVAADYTRKQSPRLSVGNKVRLALPTISP